MVGSGDPRAGCLFPSLRSLETGQNKEEQTGFSQIEHEVCWGSCEEICPLLIWTQPSFKQLLQVLIFKPPWPLHGCFILTKAFCLQAVLLWVYKESAR